MKEKSQADIANEYKRFFDLLAEAGITMSAISDIDKLLAFVVNKLAELFKASRVSFMLLDKASQELSLKTSRGLDLAKAEAKVKLGEAFGGWVAKQGDPLLVRDVEEEYPELSKDRLSRYSTKSFIIVPIKINDEVIGVLNLTDKKDHEIFTEQDLKMLTLIGRHLALHIENLRLSQMNNTLETQDPLTGLFNHRYFQEQLLEEIYRAERYKHSLSLIMLDIDNFSEYNQNYGYSSGDNVLKQIGKILKENTRQVDLAARWGPEEFMVILPETRLKQGVLVGEKIREKIAQAIFTDEEDRGSSLGMARLTVSIGIAEHRVGLDKEELIHRVEGALQEAKQKGKNRVCVFK